MTYYQFVPGHIVLLLVVAAVLLLLPLLADIKGGE